MLGLPATNVETDNNRPNLRLPSKQPKSTQSQRKACTKISTHQKTRRGGRSGSPVSSLLDLGENSHLHSCCHLCLRRPFCLKTFYPMYPPWRIKSKSPLRYWGHGLSYARSRFPAYSSISPSSSSPRLLSQTHGSQWITSLGQRMLPGSYHHFGTHGTAQILRHPPANIQYDSRQ